MSIIVNGINPYHAKRMKVSIDINKNKTIEFLDSEYSLDSTFIIGKSFFFSLNLL